ncbi:MAG TPA: cytochrome c-type biogenesis protein [Steroidobacteraceae bacterium]|nr:cytochrome c-type biogenesis protein [Steroidobacteraceae bacterium]
MFMSLIRILLLSFLLCRAAWAIDSAPAFDDPQLQARYENLTQQLRCPQCQNDSIADSNAPLAVDLRRELRDQIASGKSDAEVLKFLTDRYGAFILFKPPFEARTMFLWLGPGILLLGGLAIAVRIILQRAKLPIEPDSNQETESEHA